MKSIMCVGELSSKEWMERYVLLERAIYSRKVLRTRQREQRYGENGQSHKRKMLRCEVGKGTYSPSLIFCFVLFLFLVFET
jgi:hypothetical protein